MGIKIYIFIFLFLSFCSIESFGQIVINEIMADPTPSAGLPDREYLELFNSGTSIVNLKGWILGLGGKVRVLPDVPLTPGEFLLVTAPGGSKDLLQYGKVLEISGFALTNSGLIITLSDPMKLHSDGLEYLPSLHKKGFTEGGYSLERIDPERLCGQRENWVTTLSASGGTPGKQNSVKATNPDYLPPKILSEGLADHSRLDIQLNESFQLPVNLSVNFSNLSGGLLVDSLHADAATGLLQLCFHPSTVISGADYSVLLHDIKDECGNLMTSQLIRFGYYLPVKSDVLISEVLFNPYPDGTDFVEIFNNSGHQVELSGLSLATRDATNKLVQLSQISAGSQCLKANSYLALSKSLEGIQRFYPINCFGCLFQMEKFPGLSDQSGSVVLLDSKGEIIDEMSYSDNMHHPLITKTEGVSLERTSFSLPASLPKNWQSAARSVGFATPGYKNSVTAVRDSADRKVFIEPVIISPNGDGINDQLNIYLFTGEPGSLLNITILNCAGRVIRKLANNFTSGSSDQIIWDGLNADFQKVQPGIYVLDISIFYQSGKRESKRLACAVTDNP